MTEFPQTSIHLGLPYLQPAQAQKHVTHNDALHKLDRLVQLAVVSRAITTPPATPIAGARYLVPMGATGDWTGQDGRIATFDTGVWEILAPQSGWLAMVLDEGRLLHFDGADWVLPDVLPDQIAQLGIATSADSANRLAVASPATLLTHAGAGHQLKVNKAQAADTASLLFQSGFSGRAEIGLAGDDDLSVKVSADGTVWTEALRVIAASGQVELNGALLVGGLLGGNAVTQSPLDTTSGRVLRTGDSATLLAATPALRTVLGGTANALTLTTGAGFAALPPTGIALRFRAQSTNTGASTLALDGGPPQDCRTATGAVLPAGYIRTDTDTWALFDGTYWVLARAPELASDAAGHTLRLECGAQQTWANRSSVGTSAPTVWDFPLPFAAPPDTWATAQGGTPHLAVVSAVSATACSFDTWTLAGARAAAVSVALCAAGRWY